MSLIEKLGVIKTEFEFWIGDTELEVFSQHLVKRGVFDFKHEPGRHKVGGFGYGYGLEGLFLEFSVGLDYELIVVRKIRPELKAQLQAAVVFYCNDQHIFNKQVFTPRLSIIEDEAIFTVDLTQIPYIEISKITEVIIEVTHYIPSNEEG